jgi:predicted nucleotidyltransferase
VRLTPDEQKAIKNLVRQTIGERARVWLFGSRVDDQKRGGDIDLYIQTDDTLENRATTLCKIEGQLVMSIGDRKIDLLLQDGRTPDLPIFAAARQQGVML